MNNERGIAMPMALMVMAILTALMAGFAVLATSEPQIANNHIASTQARALAESGVERALWALTAGQNPTPPTDAIVLGANYNLPSPIQAPYGGGGVTAQEVLLGAGTFTVTIENGSQANQKNITAVGRAYARPGDVTSRVLAVRKIQVTATRFNWINPVCGLCAGGENPPSTSTTITVGGTAAVNATTSAQSGPPALAAGAFCPGVTPIAAIATSTGGAVDLNGSPDLYAPGGTGTSATQNNVTFPSTMTLSDSDMATLKVLAQTQGTYYKPSSPGGTITFTSPPPNGIIFVDTYSGNPLTASSPSSDLSDPLVDIHGNWSTGWSGWLIVAGSIQISGQVTMSGLIYAQNDVQLNGQGGGSITGAVISTNRVDTTSSTIADNGDTGNAPLVYDCPAVRSGGGSISQNWFLMPGTFREVSGS